METQKNKEGNKVYEIGYLIVSSVPEEKVAGEVENIKAVIRDNKGEFVAEEYAKLRPLAYPMKKKIGGAHQTFNESYFGWVKFELEPGALGSIKKALDANENILRYLLITTVRENTTIAHKLATPKPPKGEKDENTSGKKEMTQEEMDKTIDELVVE